MKNNYDLAHAFFYSEKRKQQNASTSFNGDKFYSYYTLVGLKAIGKNGQSYLLISDNTMTATTGKHLSNLRGACPYRYENIINVPFEYGEHYSLFENDYIINCLAKKCIENFDYMKNNSRMTIQANRDKILHYWNTINKLNDIFKLSADVKKEITSLKRKNKKFVDDLTNNEKIKELKAKQRQKDAEKIKALKAEYKKATENKNICELAKNAFSYNSDLDTKNKTKLQKVLNPTNDYKLAYCWKDGEIITTSKQCHVSVNNARILLKLWKNGKLRHGMTIENYTVLEVLNDFIIIGCHKIPVENIKCLYSELCEKKGA